MSVDLDQSMRVLLSMQELTFDWLKETYLSEPEILEYEDEDCWYHNYRSLHLPSLNSVFRYLRPKRAVVMNTSDCESPLCSLQDVW